MLHSCCDIAHQIVMKCDRNSQCMSPHVVPDDEVKQAVAQNIVGKGPLWRSAFEVMIAGVYLHSQTHCRSLQAHVSVLGAMLQTCGNVQPLPVRTKKPMQLAIPARKPLNGKDPRRNA